MDFPRNPLIFKLYTSCLQTARYRSNAATSDAKMSKEGSVFCDLRHLSDEFLPPTSSFTPDRYSHHVSGAARPSRDASAADLVVDVNFSNVWCFST
jgi:hypothetical protein